MNLPKGVKFCGVTRETDIEKAAQAGASAVGVIVRPDATLDERSENSRSISIARACELARHTPPGLEFAVAPRTADYDEIVEIGKAIGPDRMQLAQVDDPEIIRALRNSFRKRPFIKLAKVIHVGWETDLAVVDQFAPHVHLFHLDSDGDLPGGNGVPHDWNRSRSLIRRAHEHGRQAILAGGLNLINIAEAIKTAQPDGVDSESANRLGGDAVYDFGMMERFTQTALGEAP